MGNAKYLQTKVELYGANNDGQVTGYTVANATQISKGVLLELTSPYTAVAHTGTLTVGAKPTAGIANVEKEASDGSTRLGLWTQGKFRGRASGAINVGEAIIGVVDGYVARATAAHAASGAIIIGHAVETVADDAAITYRLNL